MSNKEIAMELLNKIPDYKMEHIVSFLRGFQMDDEIEDDLYCQQLYGEYLADTDPQKHETVSLEDAARKMGVELWATK